MQILVIGASGCGTTTLGRELASRLRCTHLDLDDYYWLRTSPPFQQKRDPAERLDLVSRDLLRAPDAVVSGSPMAWGDAIEDAFGLIVFLQVPTGVRLQRLQAREILRYGKADPAFLEWAARYEEGPSAGRSLARHLAWLDARKCPVLRIEGDTSVEARLALVLAALGKSRRNSP